MSKSLSKKIFYFEFIGAILVILLGSLLHFAFEWSDGSKVMALIAAVNESTWEHLKLGFWPLLFLGVSEYLVYGKHVKNLIFSKATTILLFLILIPTIFYSYTGIIGENYLIFDILTFIISVVVSQFVGFKIQKISNDLGFNGISILLIVILSILFLSLSFFPPNIFLFIDPVSGGYGIIK